MSDDTPVLIGNELCTGRVLPEWIDLNNHMNVAYYVLAFDLGIDKLWDIFGITGDYVATQRNSTFAVESHITYQGEMRLDEPFVVTSQILAFDEKRIHQFMRLYHAERHYLAATAEWINLHVDLDHRRVSPWPDEILARIQAFAEGQDAKSRPAEFGKRMQVPAPYWSIEDYSW